MGWEGAQAARTLTSVVFVAPTMVDSAIRTHMIIEIHFRAVSRSEHGVRIRGDGAGGHVDIDIWLTSAARQAVVGWAPWSEASPRCCLT